MSMRRLSTAIVGSLLILGCSDAADLGTGGDAGMGSIAGMVWGPGSLSTDSTPVAGANVLVYRSPCPPGPEVCTALAAIAASTMTDSQGRYTLDSLVPATYTAVVNPPANTPLSSTSTTVEVLGGQVARRSFRISSPHQDPVGPSMHLYGPMAVAPGAMTTVYAAVFDMWGDSVKNAAVTWLSRSPGIATVSGTSRTAIVTGVSPGTTWIVATSGMLADSMSLAVRADSMTDSTATPHDTVATVTLTPATQTKMIGDSIGFYAAIRGANGLIVSGYAVTWTSSNPAVGTLQALGTTALLHPVATGTTTITATSGGKSGMATVIVQ